MGNKITCTYDYSNLQQQNNSIQFINNVPSINKTLNFTKQSTFNMISDTTTQFCTNNKLNKDVFQQSISKLIACQQTQIFQAFKTIQIKSRQAFMRSLIDIPIYQMDNLYSNHLKRKNHNYSKVSNNTIRNYSPVPIMKLSLIHNYEYLSLRYAGLKLLQQNKVGIIIMLTQSWECNFPVNKDKVSSLQQKFTDLQILKSNLQKLYFNIRTNKTQNSQSKFIQQQKQIQQIKIMPIVVACTRKNIKNIEQSFKVNNYFGFKPNSIVFQQINQIPLLSQGGKMCLNYQYQIIGKPQGSSSCLNFLFDPNSNSFKLFQHYQIKYVHCFGTNNMLETPAHPVLLGLLEFLKAQILANVIEGSVNETIIRQSCSRYAKSQNRAYLLNPKQISENFGDIKMDEYPIALESMFFDFKWMTNLKQNSKQMVLLANKYNMSVVERNYYDFEIKKHVNRGKFYAFDKDIRDCISISKNIIFAQHSSDKYVIENSTEVTASLRKKKSIIQSLKKYT